MEKSFGLRFLLRKSKSNQENGSEIYLRITVNGCSTEISCKRRCESSKWNVKAGRIAGKTDSAKSINAYLDVLQQKVYEKMRLLMEQNQQLSARNIKTLLQGGDLHERKYMLMEIFEHHNRQMQALIGQEYTLSTYTRYLTSFKHTRSFLKDKYQLDDIEINKLDFEFITEYEFWLRSTRKCDHNTTIKYLSNFRKIVQRCIRNGWLIRDPFVGFKMTRREVERTALTDTELQILAEKIFAIDRLRLVRDIFLFSCYSGLAYVDVKKLKRSEIIVGVDGGKWLVSRRQKTETPVRIPLLPAALRILALYADHPQCNQQDWVLPILSNQKMNAYLKEIADLCGIHKNLTFHIARHTFATTVTLSNGVPIETVSKMLGHRSIKTTQHYARILDTKISQDMNRLMQKYGQ